MSTHNICFCREIRKIKILFGGKKRLIKSYAAGSIYECGSGRTMCTFTVDCG